MKIQHTFLIVALGMATNVRAQQGVSIGNGGNPPHESSILDLQSENKGFLPPRLSSAQRDAIANPAAGLRIFNTDSSCENYFNGINWFELCGTCTPPPPAQPSVISGELNPCANAGSYTYMVSYTQGVSYAWTLPDGWIIDSGNGTNSISVIAGETPGVISVIPSTSCGAGPSQTLSVGVQHVPASVSEGLHSATPVSIEWNWSSVPDATGYKWNTLDDYGSAQDVASNTSVVQPGLECGTNYSIYVWAYGDCGVSVSTLCSSATTSCCTAGIGGTITTSDDYTVHTFLSSGEFVPPSCVSEVEYLIVGGGGGGGAWRGGGGGAGGVLTGSVPVSHVSYPVTIGSGGTGGPGGDAASQAGSNGGNSSVFGFVAIGGGGGGGGVNGASTGLNGGSGGGEGGASTSDPVGIAVPGQGNNGGSAMNDGGAENRRGGGGGGAGSPGENGSSNAGNGGMGITVFGLSIGGGGGGGVSSSGNNGLGGSGGGGNGGFANAQNGVDGTGGGGGGAGGGAYSTNVGGMGGAGIVVVRYLTPQ